jgi:hypothetical protein
MSDAEDTLFKKPDDRSIAHPSQARKKFLWEKRYRTRSEEPQKAEATVSNRCGHGWDVGIMVTHHISSGCIVLYRYTLTRSEAHRNWASPRRC